MEFTRAIYMNNNEKQDFFDVITKTGSVYDKKIARDRVSVYWEALKHRALDDIKIGINRHIQDSDRGRFFPLPADISHQLPDELDAWLNPNEAWASCPKDEITSTAMCSEIAQSLCIAQDLINSGDMIAARMAFIEHYKRLVEHAKREGKKPEWFPSYGFDKELRITADRAVLEMRNLALPAGQKLALPEPPEIKGVEYKFTHRIENKTDPKKASSYLGDIKNLLKR